MFGVSANNLKGGVKTPDMSPVLRNFHECDNENELLKLHEANR